MPKNFAFDLIGFAVISVFVGYALTAIARSVSRYVGLMDVPDGGRKSHCEPMPLLGGIAVYLTICIACVAADRLNLQWLEHDVSWSRLYPLLLISAGVLCFAGLWDDKWSMRIRTKLLWQVIAALPWVVAGRSVDAVQLVGIPIELGILSYGFTVFWLVGCANIINLIDGMDGAAGTIGVVISVTAAILAIMTSLPGAAFVCIVLAASLTGFLIHNWPPAKIFLGDSGSMTIGFLVGALSLEASTKSATGLILTVPMVLLSVPIFDTAMAILRRKLKGRAIGEGDREHLHHCLQNRGLSKSKALWFILCLCLIMATSALASFWLNREWIGLAVCGAALSVLIVGRVFGHEETMLFSQQLMAHGRSFMRLAGVVSDSLTRVRAIRAARAESDFAWNCLCQRTLSLGGTFLQVRCHDAENGTWSKEWRPDGDADPRSFTWQFSHSTRKKRDVQFEFLVQGNHCESLSGGEIDELLRLSNNIYDVWARDRLTARAEEPRHLVAIDRVETADDLRPGIFGTLTGSSSGPVGHARKAA